MTKSRSVQLSWARSEPQTTLRRATRRVSQLYDAHLAPSGLRATQFPVLMVVAELGVATVNELGRHLDLDRTSTSRMLRPLEAEGYVAIAVAPQDRRSREIRLTAAGEAVLDTAKPLWVAAQRELERVNGWKNGGDLREALRQVRVA